MPPVPKAAGAAAGAGARKPPHRSSRRPASTGSRELGDFTPQKLDDVPLDPPGAGFAGTDPANEVTDPAPPAAAKAKPARARRTSQAGPAAPAEPSPGRTTSVSVPGGQDAAGAVLGILAVAFLINLLKGTSTAWLRAKFLNQTGSPVPLGPNNTSPSNPSNTNPVNPYGGNGSGISGVQGYGAAYTQLQQALTRLPQPQVAA